MNLVTILNLIVAAVCATVWLVLFFALFENASTLLRIAFVLIPMGGYISVIMTVAGAYTPTLGDLLTNTGVVCGTLWIARTRLDKLSRFKKLDTWI